jgi:hypothetical protein
VRKSESDHNHLTTSGGKSIITFVSQIAWRIIAHGLRAKIERVRTPAPTSSLQRRHINRSYWNARSLSVARVGLDHNFRLSHVFTRPYDRANAQRMEQQLQANRERSRNHWQDHQSDHQSPSDRRKRASSPDWRELVVCRPPGFQQERRGSGAWPRCEVRWVFA